MKSKNLKQLRALYPIHTHVWLRSTSTGVVAYPYKKACRNIVIRADDVWESEAALYHLPQDSIDREVSRRSK